MRHASLQWIPRSAPALRRGFAAADAAPAGQQLWPAHDPRLAPRDEIVFLLHTAAEVEHALMVQYLYAGWSAILDEPAWAATIRLIAKQEMGHLITVENILRSLRAPLNFEREDYPFRTALYPFRFELEPLSRASLAKYVIAEMPKNPLGLPLDPPLTAADLEAIRSDARVANMNEMVNRVGDLYEHTQFLIAEHLEDSDFSPSTAGFQADPVGWRAAAVPGMIIERITNKEEALGALQKIAEQGEGMGETGGEDLEQTHFYLFLQIYRARRAQGHGPDVPVRDLPTDPSTAAQPNDAPEAEANRISHPLARHLAQLFNLRYRVLLVDLAHALSLESDVLPGPAGAPPDQPSGRAQLRSWCFQEMLRMPGFARALIKLPRRADLAAGPPFAAPPFEMPYTLALPDQELDRWLLQADLIENGRLLIGLIRTVLGESSLSAELKAEVEALLAAIETAETGADNPASRLAAVQGHIERLRPMGEGPMTTIRELRIFPPLAIARFGSSSEPMDNYESVAPAGAGFRELLPAETLRVDPATGEIAGAETPPAPVRFRDAAGDIRPVCPFLEVWARFREGGNFEPLTVEHLRSLGLEVSDVKWRVRVANLKALRRTERRREETDTTDDRIEADTGQFGDHARKELRGGCTNFKPGKFIPFGSVQFIKPNEEFPELRLRFTPAAGKVYGPTAGDPNIADDVYDAAAPAARWLGYSDDPIGDAPFFTNPIGIYANDGIGASRGYLDDACDGIVEVELRLAPESEPLRASARFSAGPPAFAPDALPVRTVADDLEQMLLGVEVGERVQNEEVREILRRAVETVHLMNTDVMNTGGMASHDSRRGIGRLREPIFQPVSRAAYAAVREIHAAILGALEGLEAQAGTPARMRAVTALQQVLGRLREYDQVGDLSNSGRRKMPAMMRSSDGRHLALTRRQRNAVAAKIDELAPPAPNPSGPEAAMRDLIVRFSVFAGLHSGVDVGSGNTLDQLFSDPAMVLAYLRRGVAQGDTVPEVEGQPLVVPGDPDASAFVALISNPNHPMNGPFSGLDPATNKAGIQIVREWISSLQP